jgi:hypothetical protein
MERGDSAFLFQDNSSTIKRNTDRLQEYRKPEINTKIPSETKPYFPKPLDNLPVRDGQGEQTDALVWG